MDLTEQEKIDLLFNDLLYLVAPSPNGGNNFFARVLNNLEKHPSKDIPTACVCHENGRTMFRWNPDFYAEHEPQMRTAILLHEAGHIILRHIWRGYYLRNKYSTTTEEKYKYMALFNIAADLAVNSTIVDQMLVLPEESNEQLLRPSKYGLPDNLRFEDYVDILMSTDDESLKEMFGIMSLSELQAIADALTHHEGWDVSEGASDSDAEKAMRGMDKELKEAVRSAYEETERHCGNVPGHLKKDIEDYIKPTPIPWETLLKDLVSCSISSDLDQSMCWPNMMLLDSPHFLPYPGKTFTPAFTVGVFRDTSGSMSDDDFKTGVGVLLDIKEQIPNIQIYGIDCDYDIQAEYMIETGDGLDEVISKTSKRRGYSGTSFVPPYERCAQNAGHTVKPRINKDAPLLTNPPQKVDLAIYFTDGYAPVPTNIPIDTIWVIVPNGSVDSKMQRVIKLEE